MRQLPARRTGLAILALLWIPSPATALERTSARLADRPGTTPDWSAGETCSVTYANTCTGWIWVWEGFGDRDIIGIVFDPTCGDDSYQTLVASNVYAWTGGVATHGWVNTGTISVHTADETGSPGTLLASQPFAPTSGSNVTVWGLPVSGPIVVTFEHPADGFHVASFTWPSDRPAGGPTGPPACGVCFPPDRATHSFYYGKPDSPLVPPVPLNDGACDAEWLSWSAAFSAPTPVEPASWSSIKALYR